VAAGVNVVRPARRWLAGSFERSDRSDLLASNTRSVGVRLDRICTDDRRAGSRRAIGRSSSARWTRCRHPAGAGRAASFDLAGRQADGDRLVVTLVVIVVMVAILRGDLSGGRLRLGRAVGGVSRRTAPFLLSANVGIVPTVLGNRSNGSS
jgi:hypothetical protein